MHSLRIRKKRVDRLIKVLTGCPLEGHDIFGLISYGINFLEPTTHAPIFTSSFSKNKKKDKKKKTYMFIFGVVKVIICLDFVRVHAWFVGTERKICTTILNKKLSCYLNRHAVTIVTFVIGWTD